MWFFIFFSLANLFCFGFVLSIFGLSCTFERCFTHFSVALTFLLISAILAHVAPFFYNWIITLLQSLIRGKVSPGFKAGGLLGGGENPADAARSSSFFASIADFLVPVDDQLSLLDVQAVAFLLLCEYGFMVVGSHLVNILRYLKISRRQIKKEQMGK